MPLSQAASRGLLIRRRRPWQLQLSKRKGAAQSAEHAGDSRAADSTLTPVADDDDGDDDGGGGEDGGGGGDGSGGDDDHHGATAAAAAVASSGRSHSIRQDNAEADVD
eukprot:4985200-Pleurochrysis_carterae.AAC.2